MTSSDVTPWIKGVPCSICGRPVWVSKESFRCSFAGTGTIDRPESTVRHIVCPPGEEKA